MELSAPALRVPVPPVIGVILRDHDQVPDARLDHVVAARAAVRLLDGEPADIEPRDEGPHLRIGLRATDGAERFVGGAAVLPRHQPAAPATRRTNGAATPASSAPTSRGSRFLPRTLNEWSPP